MRARHFSRRLVGLLAAYLVALQALVLPLSLSPSQAFAGSLCLGSAETPGEHPAGHDKGCPCCAGCGLLCHAPALAGAPLTLLPAPHARLAALLTPPPLLAAATPVSRTPQMPRGPPAA